MKVAIANDHAGNKYKFSIVCLFKKRRGIEVINFGTDKEEKGMDYADVIHPARRSAVEQQILGIILWEVAMVPQLRHNHHQKIRALCVGIKRSCFGKAA